MIRVMTAVAARAGSPSDTTKLNVYVVVVSPEGTTPKR